MREVICSQQASLGESHIACDTHREPNQGTNQQACPETNVWLVFVRSCRRCIRQVMVFVRLISFFRVSRCAAPHNDTGEERPFSNSRCLS